ncbi:M56 family metallopeptidase [Flavimarina sp. Hel_I_48]|uniref:M56 family metallopeptidase n=1 Tax=Flavimarina sp. Hel_I_48 TaxID=1392488 RepID=UPI0004DFAAA1|nr:M56 family metallopeptidase [Flavimarina sp. Hel_I_48]
MVNYIIEIVVFQAIFLGFYLVFLRKETFFQWNRAYLLLTAALAFVLPFMELQIFSNPVNIPLQIQEFAPVFIGESSAPTDQETTQTAEFSADVWWILVYAAGLLISLGILFKKYVVVRRYFRFQQKENKTLISVPNSDAAFTFLNTIFIGNKLDDSTRNHILAHERVHVAQKHGLDLLFFELLKVLLWFNPLIYAYQKSISEVHEYLADQQAAKIIEPKSYYNQLLNTAFGTHEISFINTFFNQSLIKKRIVMLHKNSKTTAKWKYVLLVPVLAGMLTYVGCSSDESSGKLQSTSLDQQISNLQATIDAKGELSEQEKKRIIKLATSTISKEKGSKAVVSVNPGNSSQEEDNVPFAVIEEVPIYPGCEDLETNDAKKACMSERLTEFVTKNFDTSLGKKLGMTGINKIYVQFKINEEGIIEFMGSRGPHPDLEKEAERIVNLMPIIKPGKQGGQKVNVLYAMPIVFKVAE